MRLSAPLAAAGWNTVVLLPNQPGNAAERLINAGIEVIQIPLSRFRATTHPVTHLKFLRAFPFEVRAIQRIIEERGIDLVVIAGLVNPHAGFAARIAGVPVVWQVIDTRTPALLRRSMIPLVKRLSAVVMTTGVEVARAHPGLAEIGERWIPFYSPVVTREFRPDQERRARARNALGLKADDFVIGTVGNLTPQKGHEYLIRAAGLLRSTGIPFKLRVLGASMATQVDYESSLRREAESVGLLEDDSSVFVDPGDRVAELLPALDLFVLASLPASEGVPTTVMEAMACGLPVVATNVGGVKEVVLEGVTGKVVVPQDVEALRRALVDLISDNELRSRMAAAARDVAVERFDVSVCTRTHLRAFDLALTPSS